MSFEMARSSTSHMMMMMSMMSIMRYCWMRQTMQTKYLTLRQNSLLEMRQARLQRLRRKSSMKQL